VCPSRVTALLQSSHLLLNLGLPEHSLNRRNPTTYRTPCRPPAVPTKTTRAAPLELPSWLRLYSRRLAALWYVVAERRPYHVVHSLRRDARRTRWQTPTSGPSTLGDVRIRYAPTHTAFRAVIELVPEPDGPLGDDLDVARAGSAGRRGE
jgi:hypothetical protein